MDGTHDWVFHNEFLGEVTHTCRLLVVKLSSGGGKLCIRPLVKIRKEGASTQRGGSV